MPPSRLPGEVLEFWFSEQARPLWFERNAAFDEEIRARFGATVAAAGGGDLDYWVRAVDSSLALVLLLDQFPRNIHRGTLRAFASDARARDIAGTAVDRGFDRRTPLDRRFFFYLPFEHAEDPQDQARSVALFRHWAEEHRGAARENALEQMKYVLRHQEIVQRFGRFPHRNTVLGRESTPEEMAFLQEPHSSF
ncbi:MAG TPA: DUF924 family protein [Candidatus Angelobacter sp.]|nr:DUF924 family protein [Candidatus Angelobacter sp.]